MSVVFTPAAVRHLDALHFYIGTRAGSATADRYIERIVAFCDRLSAFPERGTRRDDLLPGLRTVSFERRATIAFTVMPGRVLIEGVFHRGRDIDAQFR